MTIDTMITPADDIAAWQEFFTLTATVQKRFWCNMCGGVCEWTL